MDIDLALLADAATVDAAGKLNILGVFDRLAAVQYPVQHGRLALVIRFSGGFADVGSHEVSIRMKGPGGEVLRLDGTIQVGPPQGGTGGVLRIPQVFNLDGVVLPEPGRFSFDVHMGGELKVSIPLEAVKVRGPESGGDPPLPEGRGIRA
jgi:hypothetical protein